MSFSLNGKVIPETLTEILEPLATAVLVVDLQNDFAHPDGYCRNFGDITRGADLVAPIRRFVDAARLLPLPIVYTRQLRRADGSTDTAAFLAEFMQRHPGQLPLVCIEGTWGSEIVEGAAPAPEDLIVNKYRKSGFAGTSLDVLLRERQVRAVIVTGVALSGCVEATVRDALDLGYFVVVPADCVANNYSDERHEEGLRAMRRLLLRDCLSTSQLILDILSS